jgi:Leucine-rich repeat (LRR) protein
LWLIVTSTILLTSTLPIDFFQKPCSGIKNGFLSVKGDEVIGLRDYCDCSFESLAIKKAIFTDLPECFADKTMNSLHIERLDLAVFPKGILKLKGLKELSFKHTGLSFLPNEISQLKSLRSLDLRGTNINALPEGLDHLKRIDFRMTELNRADQKAIRTQYPQLKIYFSSPCNCN